uniref:histone deacetylase n=2 Tax=Paramormyrops kingsleyae TaxID=1676925 RepID=A0A3B3QZP9_9TELE|nr:histone deacetylase 9 isoform X2 [Paramormyrops kingsleyae]
MNSPEYSVEVKPEVLAVLEPASPLDLSTDSRMPALGGGDSDAWERRLQRELLLIQKQQQIQKQLLITEFQKQHENLTRQHQAQLQEHLKLQQELLTMKKQQQEQNLEKERRLEQRSAELEDAHRHEQERQRREKHVLVLRNKERARESAMASTEVRQKLQDFLLNRPAKDGSSSHVTGYRPKLWSSQHMSMDQSPPSLGTMSPAYKCTLPSPPYGRESFPLRKTASEPNLKLRSRLKQKVAERRSSPLMRRKDGSVLMVPYKKRVLEFAGSIASSSAPGSGPSSPNDSCGSLVLENGASPVSATQSERLLSHQRLLKPDNSIRLLYTSPSLPNITLALPPAASPSPIAAATALKETSADAGTGRQAHFLGTMPPVALESKVNSSHQALLQHLLHKEQMRQQKILPPGIGNVPGLPPSPLAVRERPSSSLRPKLPRHRPLNRTQSAPLPQSTLAQLVIQQQHQSFVERQKQYQQQVYINQMLSQSIEQLRQPSDNLQEEEEEREQCVLPPGGVIRKYSHGGSTCSSDGEPLDAHAGVIRVKEEPPDSEDEGQAQGAGLGERDARLQQVGGGEAPQRVIIRAIM